MVPMTSDSMAFLPWNQSKICARLTRIITGLWSCEDPEGPFRRRFFESAATSLRCDDCPPVSWEDARWQLRRHVPARPNVRLELPRACLRCGENLEPPRSAAPLVLVPIEIKNA